MTRACASCGQLFTVDPRTPRRRYCTPRCRAADWRRRHNRAPSPDTINDANHANHVRNVVGRSNDDTSAANHAARAGHSLARCPHCHTPVTVLTLLLPPAAAHVTPPQAGHG